MQNEPNPATQRKVIAGKGKKKKPMKKKKAGHALMDELCATAIKRPPAGLPGQKTIVKV